MNKGVRVWMKAQKAVVLWPFMAQVAAWMVLSYRMIDRNRQILVCISA